MNRFGLLIRCVFDAAVLAVVAVLFAGCGSKKDDSPDSAPPDTTPAAVATPPPVQSPPVAQREGEVVKAALAELSAEARLGARLFFDNRIGNPGANLATSCRTCHVPPEASGGERKWADQLAFSVMPANDRGSKLETARNTPTLLDVTAETSLPSDGQYDSLTAYLAHKLVSEHMGWRPGEEDQAKMEIQALLMNDDGTDPLAEGTYAEHFNAVKGVDVLAFNPDEALDAVIESITDYLGTVVTRRASAYDAIMFLNRIQEGLAGEEDTPQELSGRMFGRIANEEGRVLIKFPAVYDEDAYQGLKTFMRVTPTWSSSIEGEETNIGNCIACHVPPRFTDHKFHNIGVSQFAYDAVHGEGAFMNLAPGEPSEKTRARVDNADPDKADLGRWNVAPSEENIGAFKTPKLRNPRGTNPYLHDGSAATIEEAIRVHLRAADLARDGKLRNPDPELLKITGITDKDVTQLVAFIETLNGVSPEQYRDYRISNVRIRPDPMAANAKTATN